MRIDQLYCRFGKGFERAFVLKYKMRPYMDVNEPLIVFGCYNTETVLTIARHAISFGNLCIVIWAGTDAVSISDDKNKVWCDIFRGAKTIKHIAISHWIEEDLKKIDFKYYSLPILPVDNSDIKPEPLGDSILMYRPELPLYNGGIYEEIKSRVPYNFIEVQHNTYDRKDLLKAYKRCFLGLRFTQHDGLSNTACELGLMGRKVIWNGRTPNAIAFDKNNIPEIIDNIHKEYENRGKEVETASKMQEYLNIGEDWLNTEYYE
jgi:hypothetical protein